MKTNHLAVGPVNPVLLTRVDADVHHLLGHPLLHVAVVDHRVGEHHNLGTWGGSTTWTESTPKSLEIEGFKRERDNAPYPVRIKVLITNCMTV